MRRGVRLALGIWLMPLGMFRAGAVDVDIAALPRS